MKRVALFACIFILVFALTGRAAGYENVAGIFQLDVGGRPSGMAGAFLALADDENAAYYNPAGLGWVRGVGVTTLFSRQLEAVTYGAVSASLPHVGITLLRLDSGWIPSGEGDGFRYVSQAGVLASGASIGPVGLGARAKFYQVVSPVRATGWALDPALLIVTETIRFGLLVENLLSRPVAYTTGHQEGWPLRIRLGAAATLSVAEEISWNIVGEAEGLFTSTPRLVGGVEAWVGDLAGRLGYDGTSATLGLSVRFTSFQLDWGYHLGVGSVESHRVSLTFRF
jgi:hypothetical protein